MLNGELHLILGCMFSGKTSELLNKYDRYTIGGKKCIIIKYEKDTRYDLNCVSTHNGIKVKSFVCGHLLQVDNIINDYDIIFIDEVQFFNDAYIFCEKWTLINSKIIYACGLNGTFERKPFKIITKLIPLADSIIFKSAICKENGQDGLYSYRDPSTNNKEIEVIGGSDKYSAVDREYYFKDKIILNQHLNKLRLKLKKYCEINKLIVSELTKEFIES